MLKILLAIRQIFLSFSCGYRQVFNGLLNKPNVELVELVEDSIKNTSLLRQAQCRVSGGLDQEHLDQEHSIS